MSEGTSCNSPLPSTAQVFHSSVWGSSLHLFYLWCSCLNTWRSKLNEDTEALRQQCVFVNVVELSLLSSLLLLQSYLLIWLDASEHTGVIRASLFLWSFTSWKFFQNSVFFSNVLCFYVKLSCHISQWSSLSLEIPNSLSESNVFALVINKILRYHFCDFYSSCANLYLDCPVTKLLSLSPSRYDW